MKKVILAGNAITAEILSHYIQKDSRYKIAGFSVDDEYMEQNRSADYDCIPLSRLKETHSPQDCVVIMAMGYHDINRSRESMFHRLKEMGYHIESYIHPDAKIYTQHPLGEGCIILPSSVIEPHVRIGANTLIWANVTVAHHSSIAEHCWLASGAVISGQVQIRRNVFIGVNATIVNEVIIDEFCLIGAGALITKSTKASSVHLARSGEELRYSAQDYVKFFGI